MAGSSAAANSAGTAATLCRDHDPAAGEVGTRAQALDHGQHVGHALAGQRLAQDQRRPGPISSLACSRALRAASRANSGVRSPMPRRSGAQTTQPSAASWSYSSPSCQLRARPIPAPPGPASRDPAASAGTARPVPTRRAPPRTSMASTVTFSNEARPSTAARARLRRPVQAQQPRAGPGRSDGPSCGSSKRASRCRTTAPRCRSGRRRARLPAPAPSAAPRDRLGVALQPALEPVVDLEPHVVGQPVRQRRAEPGEAVRRGPSARIDLLATCRTPPCRSMM